MKRARHIFQVQIMLVGDQVVEAEPDAMEAEQAYWLVEHCQCVAQHLNRLYQYQLRWRSIKNS